MLEKFRAANVTNPDRGTDESMILRLTDTWTDRMDIRVSQIKPSHLDEWLAKQCKDGEWRNTTYNKYCTFLRRLFDIAVSDKMIYPNLQPLLEWLAQKPHTPHDSILKLADTRKASAGGL